MNIDMSKKTILIADDAEPNRLLLKKIFSTEYYVEEAKNGLEALEKLHELADVAVLILDIMMPKLDGFGVLEAMQQDEYLRSIPIVVTTANNEEDVQIRALTCGATDVMTKPFSPQIILHRIKNIMARKDSEKLAEQNRAIKLELRLMDTDEKSGLYNKNAFHRYTSKMLQKYPHKKFVLIRWDIDNFKVYNDWFGTEAGDAYLTKIGDFFRIYEEKNTAIKIYARYDADHFVCCQEADGFEPEAITKIINEYMEQLKTLDFEYTPRVGLYMINDPTLDVALMCDRALLALRSIKESYGKRYAWFDDSMREILMEQQEIVNEMEFALRDGQFTTYLQPQYNYETGKLIGAEALARWQHPRKGTLLPNQFIPLFERNGFISRLDENIWEQVCILLKKWQDRGMPLVPISVNVSRRDIYNPHLLGTIVALLQKYDLDPTLLHLEITESAYTQNAEQLVNTVNLLRNHGLEVHMDDFGSGYSSLNMLQNVPVDILKLDMRFLGHDYANERSGNILNAVVRMATALRLPVLAEGVETKEQADFLRSIGCLLMQGYFFSKPMEIGDFERLLVDANTTSILKDSFVESFEGSVDLLSFSVQSTLLFNCFVGGAAVVEYDDRNKSLIALRINDQFLAEIGTTRTEYMEEGQSVFDYYEGENKKLVVAMLDEALETGNETCCEAMRKPKKQNVEYRWFKLRARILVTSARKHFFYVAIENITQSKQQALVNERMLQCLTAAVNRMSSGVMLLDVAEKIQILYNNNRMTEMFGYTKNEFRELFAKDFLLLLHAEDRVDAEENLKHLLKGENEMQSERYRLICKDASFRWAKVAVHNMQMEEQQGCVCAVVETL
ncbi:MAG: EAL domain-containing protein [Clostridia bacterium]|nr:EAL domain-containing protein [Clostridia bacterium]